MRGAGNDGVPRKRILILGDGGRLIVSGPRSASIRGTGFLAVVLLYDDNNNPIVRCILYYCIYKNIFHYHLRATSQCTYTFTE